MHTLGVNEREDVAYVVYISSGARTVTCDHIAVPMARVPEMLCLIRSDIALRCWVDYRRIRNMAVDEDYDEEPPEPTPGVL